MAYVSIRWGKSASYHLNYALKDRAQGDVTSTHDCNVETAIEDFAAVRAEHNQDSDNQILHVMQSFSPNDSKKLTPVEFNDIGRSLALKLFEGHQFVIRTHTDTPQVHNHIVVNIVNSDSGRKIENKRRLIYQLQDHSDAICKENGLSIIDREAKERRAKIPYKAQQMVRAGKQSYIFDLAQKADVARSIATNFDEYRDTLHAFGIRTLIEDKNVSYFYPGRERGKRGSKLGRNYSNDGLRERFAANQIKFQDDPDLKALSQRQCGAIQAHGMPKIPAGASHFAQLWNGKHSPWHHPDDFARIKRRDSEKVFQSDRELLSKFVPASEIQRARKNSIIGYCYSNKIPLMTNEKGQTVIKGKEFVVVSHLQFENTKNGTYGSIIDLVAAHKNLSLLQAVSHINRNDRLLLLERYTDEDKLKFKSFYVPKPEKGASQRISATLSRFLASSNLDPKQKSLFDERQIDKMGGSLNVWLFLKEKPSSGSIASDYSRQMARRQNRVHLEPNRKAPLIKDTSSLDLEFMMLHSQQALFAMTHFNRSNHDHEIDPVVTHAIDLFLIENPSVKTVNVFTLGSNDKSMEPSKSVDFLTKRYGNLGIDIFSISSGPDIDRWFGIEPHGPDRGRGKGGRGIEF